MSSLIQLTEISSIGKGVVRSAVWTSDHKYLVMNTARSLQVYDGANTLLRTRALPSYCEALAIREDGQLIAYSCEGELFLWDIAPDTHQLISRAVYKLVSEDSKFTTRDGDATTRLLEFYPNTSILIARSQDRQIKIWDTERRIILYSLQSNQDLDKFVFSGDQSLLAAWEMLGRVTIWNLNTKEIIRTFDTFELGGPLALIFSPDNTRIAINFGPVTKIFPLSPDPGGKKQTVQTFGEDTAEWPGWVNQGYQEQMAFLNARVNRTKGAPKTLQAIGFFPHLTTAALSSDARYFAVAYAEDLQEKESVIELWDVATSRRLQECRTGAIAGLIFSPDGTALYGTHPKAAPRVWSVPDLTQIQGPFQFPSEAANESSFLFSPDGTMLAICCPRNYKVFVYSTIDGTLLWVSDPKVVSANGVPSFSPDNRLLLCLDNAFYGFSVEGKSGNYSLFIARTGMIVQHGRYLNAKISLELFALEDETHFLSGGSYYLDRVDIDKGEVQEVRFPKEVHGTYHSSLLKEAVLPFAFSPDRSIFAVGTSDGKVCFYGTVSSEVKGIASCYSCGIDSLWFSADGHTLATLDEEGIFKFWNVGTSPTPEALQVLAVSIHDLQVVKKIPAKSPSIIPPPLKEPEEELDPAWYTPIPGAVKKRMPVRTGKYRVLIVDDVPWCRQQISAWLLEDEEFEIVGEASTGREGIQKFEELLPDIVTMDINMPDMNGIRVTADLCSLYEHPYIVICSIQTTPKYIRLSMLAGARYFIGYPLPSSETESESKSRNSDRNIIKKAIAKNRAEIAKGWGVTSGVPPVMP